MTEATILDLRLERTAAGLVLVLTKEVGREVVVETLSLVANDADRILAHLQQSLAAASRSAA